MRIGVLSIAAVLALVCGCQSGQRIETRTHTLAPWHARQLPALEKTIQTTVAPEKWNEEGSPHRISATGNQLRSCASLQPGSSASVRSGSGKAQVTASFDAPAAVITLLADNDIDIDAGEPLLIRRSLKADGGSKAFINDQPCSAALLRDVGAGGNP